MMTNAELITALDQLRSMMIAVSTGGPRIDSVKSTYREIYLQVDEAISDRSIPNPIQMAIYDNGTVAGAAVTYQVINRAVSMLQTSSIH